MVQQVPALVAWCVVGTVLLFNVDNKRIDADCKPVNEHDDSNFVGGKF
jgi:hypothetical protein